MKKRKIWIITELFHPEETAVAFILTRIANFLSKKYDVSVICGPELYDKNKIDFKDNYQISGSISIFRTKTFLKLDKNSLLQRTLKVIILSLQMSFMIIKKVSKHDIVLLASHPAPLILITGVIKKFKKFQLHILVHDVFPENTIPAQIFKNNRSFSYKFLKLIFDKAYSCADHLIAIGRDMKEVLTGKTKRFKIKHSISVVPNWTSQASLNYSPKKNYSETDEESHNKIVLQYSGNVGRVQAIDVLIDAFEVSHNPDIHLIIRGTGAMYSSTEKIINSKNLRNITLLGAYSRNEENEVFSNCDISVISLAKGMFGLGVPSKTYNILAAGKPILFIGDPDSEISLMTKENDIGWSIDISNKKDIIDFLNNLKIEDQPDFNRKGYRARKLAETQYEENNILSLLQKQMEKHFNFNDLC